MRGPTRSHSGQHYKWFGSGRQTIDNNAAKYPGGSLYSSVNELARFAISMMNSGKLAGTQKMHGQLLRICEAAILSAGEEKAFYGYGLLAMTTAA